MKVWFRDRFIYLVPLNDDRPAHATTTSQSNETYKETHNVLSSFLSSLSWLEDIRIEVHEQSGGGRPNPLRYIGQSISMRISSFDKENLPDPSDKMARKALAFYRLGLSNRDVFYSFLNFYKIINIVERNGKPQQAWINSKLAFLSHFANERINELRKSDPNLDIGQYLYKLGRCAIAHANENDPTADPDDFNEIKRLRADRVIVKELSAIAIEEKFAIKSPTTLRKEPRHNITGLINTFDLQALKIGILKTSLSSIILNIHGTTQNALTKKLLFPAKANYKDKKLVIDTITPDQRAIISLILDLDKNDIFIDQKYAVYKTTNAEDKINAEISLNALLLIRDYMHGGQLRIYSNEGSLLAYGTPHMMNFQEGRAAESREVQIEAAKLNLETFKDIKS